MREEKEMGQKIRSADILRMIIGLLLLFVGFYIMSSIDLRIGYVQEFTLLIFSIVGVAVIFGNQALIWFSKPQVVSSSLTLSANFIKIFLLQKRIFL